MGEDENGVLVPEVVNGTNKTDRLELVAEFSARGRTAVLIAEAVLDPSRIDA